MAAPAAAQDASARIGAALRLYGDGKAVSARQEMERLLAEPAARDPTTRLAALRVLLDVCIHSLADACVAQHGPDFVATARAAPSANDVLRAELAREAAYYADAGRLASGRPQGILDGPSWAAENAYNGDLYLRRQLLGVQVLLALDRPAEAGGRIDRILSLIAAARSPEAGRFTLAHALSETLSVLAETGETERAWGLYRASGPAIAGSLPPRSVDAVRYRLTEARLLQEVGDLKGSGEALEAAVAILTTAELDPPVRDRLLARALSLRAAVCAAQGQMDCARQAVREHPAAAAYAQAGRAPADPEALTYLAVRALVAALDGGSDPAAAEALRAPLTFRADRRMAGALATYRAAGIALGLPPGAERQSALAALGPQLRERGQGQPGWRPGAVEQLLIALALTQAGGPADTDADATFALFQLAGRAGPSFDADALVALSEAKGEPQRRAVHQALRLRARRDRLEREQVQAVMAKAVATAPTSGVLSHDAATRLQLRDFAQRIAAAEVGPAKATAARGGLTPLARFQAALAPNEAALAVAPTVGGLAYMCVRREGMVRRIGPADPQKLKLDGRVIQQALTAGHAPSERLDSQFPVEAAGRVYDVLIRPFEGCLKPGDHLIWLAGVAGLDAPLAVLLPAAPPKLAGGGYDLAVADWLVRHHAITYAGSAGVIVAARAAAPMAAGDFDFLGVGDPVLGEAADKALLRGVRAGSRFEGLAPLPETKDELEASARGFRSTRLLLQGEATERSLRRQLVGAYSYLSFATHGLLREDLQGLSEPALVLTPVSADDPVDDGLLTASEIADLNLRARFVALSACNTANFDVEQMARDLPALSSAFAVAGVPATLATLWPVDSETGKRVVTGTFERLRAAGIGPAEAMAAAQRAFLADPPGRAYLHPRFWAPFVVLGDGGPAPVGPRDAPAVASVEVLTRDGGEVLGLSRTRAGVAVRLISDADVRGRHGAAVRSAAPGGAEAWRRDSRDVGASRFTVQLGPELVVGGYRLGPNGRYGPVLESFGLDGAPGQTWQGDGVGRVDAFILGGAATGAGQAVFAVGEVNLRDAPEAGGGRLHVFAVDQALSPRRLFEVAAPAGTKLSDATITPIGGDLLVTYTDRTIAPAARPAQDLDDYDDPLCLWEPVTWLELRDGRTGALKASRELRGRTVVTALAGPGRVLLGGAILPGCGEDARAEVLAVDATLATLTIHADDSLGASEVRTLAALPGGRTFVAASKEGVVDFPPPPAVGATPDPYRTRRLDRTFSGMVLTLGRDGKASAPRLLDSGSNVLVTAAQAGAAGEILLGGSLGGEAAIFHLAERPQ